MEYEMLCGCVVTVSEDTLSAAIVYCEKHEERSGYHRSSKQRKQMTRAYRTGAPMYRCQGKRQEIVDKQISDMNSVTAMGIKLIDSIPGALPAFGK